VVVDRLVASPSPCWGGIGPVGEIPSASGWTACWGGKAVLSGFKRAAAGRLPLIASAGTGAGGGGPAAIGNGLYEAARGGRGPELQQEAGRPFMQQLDAAAAGPKAATGGRAFRCTSATARAQAAPLGPPALAYGWGIGCERDTSLSLWYAAVDRALSEHQLAPQAGGRAGQLRFAKG